MPAINNITNNITNNVTGTGAIRDLESAISRLDRTLVQSNNQFGRTQQRARRTTREITRMGRAINQLNTGFKAFLTFNISRALTNIAASALNTINEFQRLDRVLRVTTGASAAEVEDTFNSLARVAADLPDSVLDVTQAFTRLNNLGLDSSADALRDFANLSAGLGRNLGRLIEGVADASTFEFERLKEEFGIIARQTDDTIRFTFRGTTTEVEKTAAAVQGFLRNIAQENFGGAANAQLETLAGSFGNLTDAVNQSIRQLDNAVGLSRGLSGIFNSISRSIRIASGTAGFDDINQGILDATRNIDALETRLVEVIQGPDVQQRNVAFPTQVQQSVLITEINNQLQEQNVRLQDSRDALQRYREQLAQIAAPQVSQAIVQNLALQEQAFAQQTKSFTDALGPMDRFNAQYAQLVANLTVQGQLGLLDDPAVKQAIDDLTESARQAQTAFDTQQAQRRVDQLNQVVTRNLGQAGRALDGYQDILERLAEPQIANLVNRNQIVLSAQRQLLEQTLEFIGDAALNDGTIQAERAFQERYQRIETVVRIFGQELVDEIGLINRLQADQVKLGARELADAFEESRVSLLGPTEAITREINQIFNRFADQDQNRVLALAQNTLNGFFDTFNIDDSNIRSIEQFDEAFSSLFQTLSLQGLDVDQGRITQLLNFADNVLGGNSTQGPELNQLERFTENFRVQQELAASIETLTEDQNQRLINLQRNHNEELFELRSASVEDFLSLLQNSQTRQFALEKSTTSQRLALYLEAGEALIAGFTEQSETVFKISKALAASQIAIDLYKAIAGLKASAAQGGFLGLASSVVQIGGLITEFKGYIDDIEGRGLGDSSTDAGSTTNSSSLRSDLNSSNQATQANVNINVFGSILDEGGFEEAIARGTRNALDNDNLIIRQTDVRRF